ncbi:hypothetical protein MC378_04930 [Polaribacter sp. MSW13]|uniref:DUF3566 domain-containing protein n=1 Tax=Polaribacter marinus TaxID=2916838 RepID=A0A9X1VLS3_9FLAO|nr:hypothetical protein [Polaribacter marinus]MCI2228501.1 hypothetical protein [Polaribacter marinus]
MSNLKLKLKKVDAVKYGIITGATMALLSFIMLSIAFLFTSLIGLGSDAGALGAIFGGGIIMIILAPILYFIIGFIVGWIGAIIVNFILKKTDGLNLEFENTGLDINQIGNE